MNIAETSSTENLWAILQEIAKELQTVLSVKQLTRQLRRHGLIFRRMCFTQVSGVPGGICYFITNNGGYISNL